jgi:colanic acid/amylovoran biosynthesis glycosyltransferase
VNLAYLTNQYPKISHSFIRREICALETEGIAITRFSIRRARENFPDPADRCELARTQFLLERGVRALSWNTLRIATSRPCAFAKAWRAAFKMGWRSRRGLGRHFVYLAEACLLQTLCAARGITHLHVHHATNPAAVALLCRTLGGPSYSLTIHGPEEFEHAPRLALNEKIEHAAFVVTVSEWSRRQILPWCEGRHHEKIHIVRNGVDELFSATMPRAIQNTPHFLWIGRMEEQKDPLLLARAVRSLRTQRISCLVTMIGDGALRGLLEKEIVRHGLQEMILTKGWASRAQILDALRGARALILSSRAENAPSVIVEALLQRRPVISTDVGGVSEMLWEGEAGWLVPPNSPEDLARAMRRVLETDVTELERLGLAGRRFVLENFDAARQAKQLRLLLCGADARAKEN